MAFFRKAIACLSLMGVSAGVYAVDYDVRDFGAKGDGVSIDTKAIQAAVDRCTKTGGRVVLSGGDFLSGTIYMKDHVTLVVERGAKLLGSTNVADYPHNRLDFRFYGDTWVYQSLIFAHNVKHIGIEGGGVIDGQGGAPAFAKSTTKKPDRYRDRPYLFWMAGCEDVVVRDVHLQNSAMWMQSYIRCDRLRIENITIFNHSNKNNDMIDIDGCRDVVIRGVIGDTDDDGITFKSTCDRISENITVSDCILSSHCNALKFGTETTAGFRNVTITNCVIRESARKSTIYGFAEGTAGLALEIVDGGVLENVIISNVVIDGPRVPLFIRLGNRARKHYDGAPELGVGTLRNVHISNLVTRSSSPISCSVQGIPGAAVEGITLSDCRFVCTGGGTKKDAETPVEELETLYPESTMFGNLPSWGLYLRHAKNIGLRNIVFELKSEDVRPTIVLDDVQGAVLAGLRAEGATGSVSVVEKNCSGIEK